MHLFGDLACQRVLVRPVLFAPQMHNVYGSATFPAISDALFGIKLTNNWKEIKKQVSIAITCLREAGKLLLATDDDKA